ncbi:TAXI family TRAP transporter solute-binding subunit [Couchioplanes caeruleus]|nr:TAXI family TRAP transporter solute-binding subunit [Couchioplanes caeruleus]
MFTRTLFENHPQLARADAAGKEISLDKARRTEPVTLHRGAVQALDDPGAPR